MQVVERGLTLSRIFNIREGFSDQDDVAETICRNAVRMVRSGSTPNVCRSPKRAITD